MVEPLTLLSNNALKTMKALLCKGLKLSGNKPLVLGSIKETEEPDFKETEGEGFELISNPKFQNPPTLIQSFSTPKAGRE
jgi:hypothetical protein